jgi:prepilin-type processing-associated H-X9-DG protein
LVELLVSIAVIGVLMSILLPVFGTIQGTADKTTCVAHLKQIVAASNLAACDNNGKYPNMHGYAWEQGSIWIESALAPYIGSVANINPTQVLRCPAAAKNSRQAWLESALYCHYRFNIWYAQDHRPAVGYADAMLFFDTTYIDWTSAEFAHSPGGSGYLNVAYADGHIATLTYATYESQNPNSNEQLNPFFELGWIK